VCEPGIEHSRMHPVRMYPDGGDVGMTPNQYIITACLLNDTAFMLRDAGFTETAKEFERLVRSRPYQSERDKVLDEVCKGANKDSEIATKTMWLNREVVVKMSDIRGLIGFLRAGEP